MKLKRDLTKIKVLCISDQHAPYHHPDALRFLKALEKKYGFDLVINMGDAFDFHNISFHKSDPDLLGAGDELVRARKYAACLEKLFPEMWVIGSNHGDLPLRKFIDAGLPRKLLRSYNDIYEVGPGWKFVDDLYITGGGMNTYFAHGISKNGLKLATQRGVNVVQGHYHSEFRIDYVSNPMSLLWSMQVGCLIDKRSLAFSYNSLDLARPILGLGMIDRGQPKLLPMLLSTDGRWTGVIP